MIIMCLVQMANFRCQTQRNAKQLFKFYYLIMFLLKKIFEHLLNHFFCFMFNILAFNL